MERKLVHCLQAFIKYDNDNEDDDEKIKERKGIWFTALFLSLGELSVVRVLYYYFRLTMQRTYELNWHTLCTLVCMCVFV